MQLQGSTSRVFRNIGAKEGESMYQLFGGLDIAYGAAKSIETSLAA
jgi:hypothetical protein